MTERKLVVYVTMEVTTEITTEADLHLSFHVLMYFSVIYFMNGSVHITGSSWCQLLVPGTSTSSAITPAPDACEMNAELYNTNRAYGIRTGRFSRRICRCALVERTAQYDML